MATSKGLGLGFGQVPCQLGAIRPDHILQMLLGQRFLHVDPHFGEGGSFRATCSSDKARQARNDKAVQNMIVDPGHTPR